MSWAPSSYSHKRLTEKRLDTEFAFSTWSSEVRDFVASGMDPEEGAGGAPIWPSADWNR